MKSGASEGYVVPAHIVPLLVYPLIDWYLRPTLVIFQLHRGIRIADYSAYKYKTYLKKTGLLTLLNFNMYALVKT